MFFISAFASMLMALATPADQAEPKLPQLQENQEKPTSESKVDYSKPWHEIVVVPDDVEILGENELPHIPAALVRLQSTDTQRGWRNFSVVIKPGQTFRATLKAMPIADYFINFALPKDTKNPLFSKLKRLRNTQVSFRRSYIELTNTLETPYPIVFYVFGLEENPYSITLKRS